MPVLAHPVRRSDVQTAPGHARWSDVAAQSGGLIGHSTAEGDKGNTVRVSEPMLTYRTEVKEVALVAG
jgi:hypothetical protein